MVLFILFGHRLRARRPRAPDTHAPPPAAAAAPAAASLGPPQPDPAVKYALVAMYLRLEELLAAAQRIRDDLAAGPRVDRGATAT